MLIISFVAASLVLGLFLSYIWSSNGWANTATKVMFSLYTLFAAAMLLGILAPLVAPLVAASGLKLF